MASTDVERFIEIQDESNHYDIASPNVWANVNTAASYALITHLTSCQT